MNLTGQQIESAVEIVVAQFERPMYQVARICYTGHGGGGIKYLQQRAVAHSNKY